MKKYLLLAISMNLMPLSHGQSATFTDDVLTVPGVGVVEEQRSQFYENVTLQYEGDGLFRIVEAESRSLVSVDFIHIAVNAQAAQAVVTAEGYKSVPCADLLWPAVNRSGDSFSVVLAEAALAADESCIAIPDPYTRAVTLDLAGLTAGSYTVRVNGVDAEFTLETDAGAPGQ